VRRLGALLAVIATAAAALAGEASAAISLSPTGDAKFPQRAYVVTLPQSARLVPGEVKVTENGAPVHGLRVAPVGAARRAKLGVVLAIDASSSMRGEAFAGAIEAARAFARERDPSQPIAVLTFGTGSRVLQPFTTLDDEIDAALDNPGRASGGTEMYNAALRSVQLVRQAKLKGGFVVVLSDGSDHGSSVTGDQVVAAARAAHVRLYGVGLESSAFDPQALGDLAREGGGSYSQATSAAELQGIYRALGAQLSNAHVLTYRSLAPPGRRIDVRANIDGIGSASASYTSPKLDLGGPAVSSHRHEDEGWSSISARLILVAVVTGLLGLALLLVLRLRHRTPRDRVTDFIASHADGAAAPTLTGRIAAGAERSISNATAWEGLGASLDTAGIGYTAGQVVLWSALAAVSLAMLIGSLAGPVGLLALVVVPFGVWVFIRYRVRRERRRFADQLSDHLAVVGGSLRVGHSLTGALAAALDEAPDPARREFARAVTDERLGMPLEDALDAVSQRMQNRDIEHISLLAKLQREAGADAAEMIDQVVTTVRERQELRRTVSTLTAQGRFSQLVLSLMPVGSLAFLTLAYNDYVQPLYHTTPGHIVLAVAFCLLVSGALVIQKIVSFKV
jgi:tight adherence protein B